MVLLASWLVVNPKKAYKERQRFFLLVDRALGFRQKPIRKWTGPKDNPWAFKKGDLRRNKRGRLGYRASFCRRGHMRSSDNLYKGGDCKLCVKQCRTLWARANPRKHTEIQARYTKRHARQHYIHTRKNALKRRQRVPDFGQTGIKKFYLNCPISMEVDHIIPLHGKTVSGLHVIWNLQYLPKVDNIKKSNKFVYTPTLCSGLPLS